MLKLIIWLIAAYGLTQILVHGSIFDKPRNWVTKHSKFLGDLFGCMMCTSTWVGFFYGLILWSPTSIFTNHYYVNVFFDGMLASGGVWAINSIVEWFEENRPK